MSRNDWVRNRIAELESALLCKNTVFHTNVDEGIESEPHASCTECHGDRWFDGVPGRCAECGKETNFGIDGVCKCGLELCFDCYYKGGHQKHMIEEETQ